MGAWGAWPRLGWPRERWGLGVGGLGPSALQGACDRPARGSVGLRAPGTGHSTNAPAGAGESVRVRGNGPIHSSASWAQRGSLPGGFYTSNSLSRVLRLSRLCCWAGFADRCVPALGSSSENDLPARGVSWDMTLPGWVWEWLDRGSQHWKFGTGCRTVRQQLQGRDRDSLP